MARKSRLTIPTRAGEGTEIDYSNPGGDDFEALSRDTIPIHSMRPEDIDAIIRIDRHVMGRDRSDYLRRKAAEAMEESAIRVSIVGEVDGEVAGFIMARIDFGSFGHTDPAAVIDNIGVDPAHTGRHVGHALMSQLLRNLTALRVERVRTEVDWDRFGLLGFLNRCGFAPAERMVLRRRL
jgi:ribosomal protein S18 acetylase RimI-like enzyme